MKIDEFSEMVRAIEVNENKWKNKMMRVTKLFKSLGFGLKDVDDNVEIREVHSYIAMLLNQIFRPTQEDFYKTVLVSEKLKNPEKIKSMLSGETLRNMILDKKEILPPDAAEDEKYLEETYRKIGKYAFQKIVVDSKFKELLIEYVKTKKDEPNFNVIKNNMYEAIISFCGESEIGKKYISDAFLEMLAIEEKEMKKYIRAGLINRVAKINKFFNGFGYLEEMMEANNALMDNVQIKGMKVKVGDNKKQIQALQKSKKIELEKIKKELTEIMDSKFREALKQAVPKDFRRDITKVLDTDFKFDFKSVKDDNARLDLILNAISKIESEMLNLDSFDKNQINDKKNRFNLIKDSITKAKQIDAELEEEKAKFDLLELTDEKYYEQFTDEELFVFSSHYTNRFVKIVEELNDGIYLHKKLGTFYDSVADNEIPRKIDSADVRTVLKQLSFLKGLSNPKFKAMKDNATDETTVEDLNFTKVPEEYMKKYRDLYKEHYDRYITTGNDFEADYRFVISNRATSYCMYALKDFSMDSLLYSLLTNNSKINFGLIKEAFLKKNEYGEEQVLIGVDAKYLPSVRLHFPKIDFEQFVMDFVESGEFPNYLGNEDFTIRKIRKAKRNENREEDIVVFNDLIQMTLPVMYKYPIAQRKLIGEQMEEIEKSKLGKNDPRYPFLRHIYENAHPNQNKKNKKNFDEI